MNTSSTDSATTARRVLGGLSVPAVCLLAGVACSPDATLSPSRPLLLASRQTPPAAKEVVTAAFTGLGEMPGDVITASSALDVSADGLVVVGARTTSAGADAFFWTAETGMIGLGDLGGGYFESRALGVSADGGVIVGEGYSGSGREAFLWTPAAGLGGLGDLPGGTFGSTASAVSGDGTVIVGYGQSALGTEAFVWTAGSGMVGLGDLAGGIFRSKAYGVSPDGAIVVGESAGLSGVQAFKWTAADGMTGLGFLPGGALSKARASTPDGGVIVGDGRSALGAEAFRWTAETGMAGLGDLAGGPFSSVAFDVSADGAVIVGSGAGDLGSEAFVWYSADGMRNLREMLQAEYGLDLTGWVLTEARAVSQDGMTIVGWGVNPTGRTEAWQVRFDLTDTVIAARIDVKPENADNTINLKSRGIVEVAVFGGADLDAAAIDPLTVRFAGAGVRLHKNGRPQISFQDIDRDGRADLLACFAVQDLDLTMWDTAATLEGSTLDGGHFAGTDAVRVR